MGFKNGEYVFYKGIVWTVVDSYDDPFTNERLYILRCMDADAWETTTGDRLERY